MVNDDRLERLLQSLKYPAMNERRNHVSKSYTGTFQWVLDADGIASNDDSEHNRWDNFGDWLKSGNDIYWISGKPGSGKAP